MTNTLTTICNRLGITMTADWADTNPNMMDPMPGASHWRCTLKRRSPRRSLTVYFSMGAALSREPEADDVLGSMLMDASGADQNFEDWAADLGYDTDSRKAERTWRVVQRQAAKLRAFLGDDLEAAQEAAQDW